MTVRDGVHRLVGVVSTGQIFNDMNTILKGILLNVTIIH